MSTVCSGFCGEHWQNNKKNQPYTNIIANDDRRIVFDLNVKLFQQVARSTYNKSSFLISNCHMLVENILPQIKHFAIKPLKQQDNNNNNK